eukprot:gene5459-5460_t
MLRATLCLCAAAAATYHTIVGQLEKHWLVFISPPAHVPLRVPAVRVPSLVQGVAPLPEQLHDLLECIFVATDMLPALEHRLVTPTCIQERLLLAPLGLQPPCCCIPCPSDNARINYWMPNTLHNPKTGMYVMQYEFVLVLESSGVAPAATAHRTCCYCLLTAAAAATTTATATATPTAP